MSFTLLEGLFFAYLLGINLLTFLLFGLDKRRARQAGRRIPEKTLLLHAALGGTIGAWMGMRSFRHKTLHRKFRYGIPLLLLLQLLLALLLSRGASS